MGIQINKVTNGKTSKWELCEFTFLTPFGGLLYDKGIKFRRDGLLQLFSKFNWYTWQLFDCTFEYEPYGPLFSLRVHLLGLGFYISFNPPWETIASRKLKKRVESIKSSVDLTELD